MLTLELNTVCNNFRCWEQAAFLRIEEIASKALIELDQIELRYLGGTMDSTDSALEKKFRMIRYPNFQPKYL